MTKTVIRYCATCGNPDCPKVAKSPYFRTCPGEAIPLAVDEEETTPVPVQTMAQLVYGEGN